MKRFACGLLILLGLVAPSWAQGGKELGRIPGRHALVFHFQAGTVYKSPAMKQIRDIVALAGPRAMGIFEERFQPGPHQIDRVTLVVKFPTDDAKGLPQMAFMVSTLADINPKDLPFRLGLDGKSEGPQEGPLWTENTRRRNPLALALLEPRLLVVGDKSVVGEISNSVGVVPAASAYGGIGGHHMGLHVVPTEIPEAHKKDIPPQFAFLNTAKSMTATIDLNEMATIRAKLTFADAKASELAEGRIREMANEAIAQLEEPRKEMLAMLESRQSAQSTTYGDLPKAMAGLAGLAGINQAIELLKNPPMKRTDAVLAAEMTTPAGVPPAFLATALYMTGLSAPAMAPARKAASRSQSMNQLKQIGLAFHNYHDAMGKFPTDITDPKTGKPLLSWRVAILPYIEQDALYKQFKLNEPWDSEHNLKLAKTLVPIYTDSGSDKVIDAQARGLTPYQTFVGKKTLFDGPKAPRLQTITDGTSNTLMVVEAREPVIWTKPGGLAFDADKDLPDPAEFLGTGRDNGFNAVFCDGAVRFLKHTIDRKTLKWLIMPNDGNPIPEF